MNQIEIKVPDFRYPADVAKDANRTLKEAIAQRDGHAVVASLVQLGLAKTSVSKKNVFEVCESIDGVLAKEGLLDPDMLALVYLLKCDLVNNAPRSLEVSDSFNVDWNRVIDPLQSGDVSALQRPLSEYSDLIEPGDEWGSRCIPTLYDFLMMRFVQETYLPYEHRQNWLSKHLTDQDIMPCLYIEQYIAHGSLYSPWETYSIQDEDAKLYQKYNKYPESALFLLCKNPNDKYYDLYKDYIARYPESELCANIKNLLARLEDCRVSLSYPSLVSSSQGLTVTANSRNVREFTLTLYRLNKTPDKRSSVEIDVKDFTPVQTRVVHAEGVVPFDAEELTATFDPVPFGQYIILASYNTPRGLHSKDRLREDNVYASMVNVSDLRTFRVTPEKIETRDGRDYRTGLSEQIFAVDAQTGKPINNVDVTYSIHPRYRQSKEYKLGKTNQDGYFSVECKDKDLSYSLSKGDDKYLPEQNDYVRDIDQEFSGKGLSLHTDLGIYRPGETVHLSVVAWKSGYYKSQPVANLALEIEFMDASRNKISTQSVTTDALGQALVDFQIPTDRMNGQFCISVSSVDSKTYYSETKYIDVSEYKTPTFYIDLSNTSSHQLEGEQVRIKGRVMAYSGMPVAETEVSCRLSARSWMWWNENADFETRSFTITTDKEGRFEYLCPAEWTSVPSEKEARRPFLTYSVHATCTNSAGETHENSRDFWIGNSRGLSCSDQVICIEPGKLVTYHINLVSSDPSETSIPCHYTLSRIANGDTIVVKEADFMSDEYNFNWDKVPSGEYVVKAYIIGDEEANKAEAHLTLYRNTDALPPVSSSLWLPKESQKMDEDGHVRVLIGNTSASYIYYIIGSRDHIIKSGWVHYEPGMHWFTADMPMSADEKLTLDFYTTYEGHTSHESAYFVCPIKEEANLTAVSFRDKLRPGSTEHWTFRLTDQQGRPIQGGRMMLELYNEALHALSPNNWSLYTSNFSYSMHSFSEPYYRTSNSGLEYLMPREMSKALSIKMPRENHYGHSFYQDVVQSRSLGGKMMAYSSGLAVEEEADAFVMRESVAAPALMKASRVMDDTEESNGELVEINSANKDNVAIRTEEVKVALWKPQLTSDADGNFSIEFEVPNFNTTYHFQALAYSPLMKSDFLRSEVLAQRPVMVQSSLPRFLRSGDCIELAANVMNATDSLIEANALIELFDPRTNEVILSENTQCVLGSHETKVLRISYEAPQDAPYVGFRVKALTSDGNGDGEQVLLPILSNITPVVETQPFYMKPQSSDLLIDVSTPSLAKDGNRLTLEYCNNPTWYCVTALPTIIDTEAITSTALAHNLFALTLTAKLSAENKLLAEAIRSWKEKQGSADDILVSPLQQNEDLKISPLLASPWLPEAQRQQLRMQALDQLFDKSLNESLTTKIITSLQRLQAKDGGFLWLDFNGDRSEASYWATGQVLELLGEIHRLGCLPDNAILRNLIVEAMHYYDAETIKIEEEMLKDAKKYDYKPSYLQFWGYIYTRNLLADIAGFQSKSQGKAVFKLADKTLAALEKDWGELRMTDRALAAVTLMRYQRTSKARSVMESVRQFALHDPHKGMYWESLDESGFSPVACTSAMLQAFAEVSPRQEEIDEMREWLLLEKQTSDWGSSSMAIDAVYAILSSGFDWLHASSVDSIPQFQILVDGKPVVIAETDRLLGYICMSLPADTKKVEISRTGVNPAWGSLYHQFKAPMTEVKAQGVEELQISKQILRVNAEGKAQKLTDGDSLYVGDRIRTVLHISATKDLEYVTLIDQRPAFLEPVDQKSHYDRSDRFYYYLETKDMQTNAFITRLPDGNHELSYDCFVTAPGVFTSGIATIQSQYAPQFVAHSAGDLVNTYRK